MKHFVLFSMILIVASAIVLLMPQNEQAHEQEQEGFESMPQMARREIIHQMGQGSSEFALRPEQHQPMTASQSNLSITAAAADGTSDQDPLLHNTLKKQERLFETFTSRSMDQRPVSATTTKKNGIASTSETIGGSLRNSNQNIEPFEARSAFKNPDISVPVGCSKKCVQIKNTSDAIGGNYAIGGNCVNPPISNTNQNPDYSKKYCPAFRVPDGDYSMLEQECATCGYYTYTANCEKYDLKNPNKCTLYGSYHYEHPTGTNDYINCKDNDAICNLFHGVGATNAGGDDGTGLTCSKDNCPPKQVSVDNSNNAKCVIPGCISMDDGMLPQPKDFYGNDRINPCIGKGQNIKCPAIAAGSEFTHGSYNSVSSTDLCYTTNGKPDQTKFQSMNQVCIQEKPKSQQNFVPVIQQQGQGSQQQGQGIQQQGQGIQQQGQGIQQQGQGSQQQGQGSQQQGQGSQQQGQGSQQQGQSINVYHHAGRGRQRGSVSNNAGSGSSGSSTYVDPVPGTLYLGIF